MKTVFFIKAVFLLEKVRKKTVFALT